MVDGVEEQSRFAGWRREVWLFMKAQLSAQIATVIDFLITILLVKLFGIYYLYATFIGSVVGGIVNCVINYEWVFKAEDCKKIHVGLKYFIVWGGSILINTWGTFALTEWLATGCWDITSMMCLSCLKLRLPCWLHFSGTIICNGFSSTGTTT